MLPENVSKSRKPVSRGEKKENQAMPEKVLGDGGDPEIKQPEEEVSRALRGPSTP